MTERNRSSAFMDLTAGEAASRDALKFLGRFDLIPTPDNYLLAFHFASGEGAAQLMARADRALFQAKRDGRNCVRAEFAAE